MNIKEEGLKEFKKQIDPDESEFECFFHYTDDLLFAAGFVKGYVFKENGKATAIDTTYLKVKAAAGFKVSVASFAKLENIFSERKELALKVLSVTPESRVHKVQLELFEYYNTIIKEFLGL